MVPSKSTRADVASGVNSLLKGRRLHQPVVEALVITTEGHEDAPELVLVFDRLQVEDLQVLSEVFDLQWEDLQMFAGWKGGKHRSKRPVIEVSGYISCVLASKLKEANAN